MATTTYTALRYPTSTDLPNGPQQIQNLASDLDQKVGLVVANPAARAALTSKYDGLRVYEQSTKTRWQWDGAQWVLDAWLGSDRTLASGGSLPGIALTYSSAAIANNSSTAIGGWTTVTGPPTVHSALVNYNGTTSIRPQVSGRMRVSAYANSDTTHGGQSVMQITGPTVGVIGTMTDRRHRGVTGYSGSGTLEQWLDVVVEVRSGDLIGMTIYQNNPDAVGVTYATLLLQAHYL